MRKSSNAAELHAAADAERELPNIRLSRLEILRRTGTLENWQEVAAQLLATTVLAFRRVYDALARSESRRLRLFDKRSGEEALALKRSLVETRCGLLCTLGSTTGRLHDQKFRQSSEVVRVPKTTELTLATGP